MNDKLTFRVQGSQPEPYTVEFWREGSNLTTRCTCQAGQKGMYCKHRFALIEGDMSGLVSDNRHQIPILHELILGTDVADAFQDLQRSLKASETITEKLALSPDRRRKTISALDALSILKNGGLMKGNGGTNKFDVYDANDRYCGSVPTKVSVFKEDLTRWVPSEKVNTVVRTDRQLHNTSQGIYCFLDGSSFAQLLLLESKLSEFKLKLKEAMKD
jgi:hypothetical protein